MLDVIECFKQPGNVLRVGKMVKKQDQLFNDPGVTPPTSV